MNNSTATKLTSTDAKIHWENIYQAKKPHEVSWFQANPDKSHELILATGVSKHAPIIDVGAGATRLVEVLLDSGFSDLTVLDISCTALQRLKKRLGARESRVTFVEADVTEFQPRRRFAVWHDRAVFHFLTKSKDRERYFAGLRASLEPRGHVIIASFGLNGPSQCSGLDVVRYSAETLSDALGSDFSLMESAKEHHITPTGAQQEFVYCRFRAKA